MVALDREVRVAGISLDRHVGERATWTRPQGGFFAWLESNTYKMHVRVFLSRFRAYDLCATCQGRRLNEHALSYRIHDKTIADFRELEIRECLPELASIAPRSDQGRLARDELVARLGYLQKVGLEYLSLSRQARTLSAGEAQRVTNGVGLDLRGHERGRAETPALGAVEGAAVEPRDRRAHEAPRPGVSFVEEATRLLAGYAGARPARRRAEQRLVAACLPVNLRFLPQSMQ